MGVGGKIMIDPAIVEKVVVVPDNAVKLALIGGIIQTFAIIAGVIVSLINKGKLDTIHTLTNSNLSKVTSQLSDANTKIGGLERLVTSLVDQKVVADRLETDKIQGANNAT